MIDRLMNGVYILILIRHSFPIVCICYVYVRTIFFENAFQDLHHIFLNKSNILIFRKS